MKIVIAFKIVTQIHNTKFHFISFHLLAGPSIDGIHWHRIYLHRNVIGSFILESFSRLRMWTDSNLIRIIEHEKNANPQVGTIPRVWEPQHLQFQPIPPSFIRIPRMTLTWSWSSEVDQSKKSRRFHKGSET